MRENREDIQLKNETRLEKIQKELSESWGKMNLALSFPVRSLLPIFFLLRNEQWFCP